VDDQLSDAKGVVIVAKGFARRLELGEGEDLVGAHEKLKEQGVLKGQSREIDRSLINPILAEVKKKVT